MDIHAKINFKADAIYNLTTAQYFQLIKRNLLALAPYYRDRLKRQAESVREAESFKAVFGKYRYQLENNI